jgi:hypothetical protein
VFDSRVFHIDNNNTTRSVVCPKRLINYATGTRLLYVADSRYQQL